YNILLKDDKGYPFIRVDLRQEYPEMTLSSRSAKDGARYFGPFGGRSQTREIIDTISKALLLPDCGRRFPRDVGKDRPCLNYHMGSCAGWCLRDSDPEDYRARMRQAALILDGKSGELLAELRTQMEQAAEELRFEKAATLRDRMRAIESVAQKQRVIATAFADTDAVGFARGAKSCFTVLHFVDGDLAGKDVEMLEEPLEGDFEAVSDLVRQYYTARRGGWPKTVLLPCEIEDREELESLLSETAGRRIYLETPKRGERMRLIENAALNAREEIQRRTTVAQRRSKALERLQ
ncbi:MAG: UvrB/UvrC motif-containing protein, partial [Oscillospiraceae bacterium]|nr:UvrB/UvrC motif-containing protein [Oscillospiraceae bacterium]